MAKQTNTPNDWRLLAERDMAVADHLAVNMAPVPTEIIAFLCQQAAEKYLKGALVILGEDPPYTHDLDELCRLAENHRPVRAFWLSEPLHPVRPVQQHRLSAGAVWGIGNSEQVKVNR